MNAFALPQKPQPPARTEPRPPGEFQRFIKKSNILHRISDELAVAAARKNKERAENLKRRKRNLEAAGWVQIH